MQSLESIPAWFSDYMDISLEAAQVILSIAVILAVLLPTFYLARGTRAIAIEIILLFLTMGALVGIGWLPFWIIAATIALCALAVAILTTRGVVGG